MFLPVLKGARPVFLGQPAYGNKLKKQMQIFSHFWIKNLQKKHSKTFQCKKVDFDQYMEIAYKIVALFTENYPSHFWTTAYIGGEWVVFKPV